MKLKLISLFALLFIFSEICYAKNPPKWIMKKPSSASKYIGISKIPLSDRDCREKATKLALAEIAAQIVVKIESKSFMSIIDVDGRSKEVFEKEINQSVATHIEGHNLVDTYESDTHFYAYYELDKEIFRLKMEQKRATAISDGLDMYIKGLAAEKSNNLTNAAQLYTNGLQLIEPYLYLSLTTTYKGKSIDVANELYNALINVFSGISITTNVEKLSVEAFKPVKEPIIASLSRNNVVMQNVTLKADFTAGSGSITPPTKTDVNGTSSFYVKNVTSKESIQTINITIDESFISSLPASYKEIIDRENWPSAKVILTLINANYTAYFNVEESGIPACEGQIRSLLANNYFDLSEDTTESDLYISYSTKFEKGNVISGDVYNFNECFCSLTLKIYDNTTKGLLMEYTVPTTRVLVPESRSDLQTMQTCARELVKTFKKELPIALKNLKYNKKIKQ